MEVTNLESIHGQRIVKNLGLVMGNTIRAKHIGRDIMAGFKTIIGGEIASYTQLLSEARQQATDRMLDQARALGANAVLNVRFTTSSVMQGAAELFAYGTAVITERDTNY